MKLNHYIIGLLCHKWHFLQSNYETKKKISARNVSFATKFVVLGKRKRVNQQKDCPWASGLSNVTKCDACRYSESTFYAKDDTSFSKLWPSLHSLSTTMVHKFWMSSAHSYNCATCTRRARLCVRSGLFADLSICPYGATSAGYSIYQNTNVFWGSHLRVFP